MNPEEMKSQIKILNPRPESMIILTLPKDTMEDTLDSLLSGMDEIRRSIGIDYHTLILSDDMSIEEVPEEAMKEAGWIRDPEFRS